MALTTAEKASIVNQFKQSERDTGSPEVQVALLTTRINQLTGHLEIHKQDEHTRYGLTMLVSQRRRLMRYLKNQDLKRYQGMIEALDIRDIRD